MTLYLRLAVGGGVYLLHTAHLAEIQAIPDQAAASVEWQGTALSVVHLPGLLSTSSRGPGCCLVVLQEVGPPLALIADRADNLIALDDEEWRAIPPIGPIGSLFDAVAMPEGEERPLLRLRGELLSAQTSVTAASDTHHKDVTRAHPRLGGATDGST